MLDKEAKIKERRVIEAMKKNYMGGAASKFGVIARNLGDKITSETGASFTSTPFDDPSELFDVQDPYDGSVIHDWDMNTTSRPIGWLFDGLSRGIHLEIKYLDDEKSLQVYYEGFLVYKEIYGDLDCFVPGDWEKHIDRLYKFTKQIEKDRKKEVDQEEKQFAKEKAKTFLDKLKLRWGF